MTKFITFLIFATLLSAQDLSTITSASDAAAREDAALTLIDNLNLRGKALPGAFDDREFKRFVGRYRTDINLGASANASGGTSAVLDPLLPAAFGFSFENGSILRTTSGNTVTFKVNPAGLICATKTGVEPVITRDTRDCLNIARRFAFTAVFDTSRTKTPKELSQSLTGLGNQFSEFGARVELLNNRKPGSARFNQALQKWKELARPLVGLENEVSVLLSSSREGWVRKLVDQHDTMKAAGKSEAAIQAALKKTLDEITQQAQAMVDLAGEGLMDRVVRARNLALRADNNLFNLAAHGLILTAEYAFTRPDLATEAIGAIVPVGTRPPALHSARLIGAYGLSSMGIDFSFNASANWFSEKLPGMTESFRDVQGGINARLRLRNIRDFGTPVLTFAGLAMYLNQRPLGIPIDVFNGTKANKPGTIGVFQTKLELPTANNAVKIPVSFTWSNRTELIKESDVRAQIGISLNLDALFKDK